jgi:hypothetical protein
VPICYDRNIIARNIHLAFAHENCFETKIGQINKNQQIRMMDEFCSKTHEKWKMEATITIKSCFNVQKWKFLDPHIPPFLLQISGL